MTSADSTLKKYYFAVVLLTLVALGFLVFALSLTSGAKKDRLTDKTIDNITNNLDLYIANHSTIPETLQAAGIRSVAPTVKYTKLNDAEYKVCIYYYQPRGTFNGSFPTFYGLSASTSSVGSDNTDFNSSVEFFHKKGQNCQTVKPYLFNTLTPTTDSTLE